jgi:hypothetical protein
MRRLILSLALALALIAAGSARRSDAGVSADINLHLGHPSPVVVFDREPDVVLVPNTRVYYVSGQPYDLFRYRDYWYIDDGGYWYRARNYRGPFVSVNFDFVPRSIVYVPARFHRHPMHPWGGPPGQERRGWERDRGWDRGDRRDHGDRDDRGRGHGHGHDGD